MGTPGFVQISFVRSFILFQNLMRSFFTRIFLLITITKGDWAPTFPNLTSYSMRTGTTAQKVGKWEKWEFLKSTDWGWEEEVT